MTNKLAAFTVRQKSIASVVLEGEKLEFWEGRSLSPKQSNAESEITGFINYIVERCDIQSAGLEKFPDTVSNRITKLTKYCEDTLRSRGIPVMRASREDLFAAFGQPPLQNRDLLQASILHMFPELRQFAFAKELLDAGALALYLQTDRLFARLDESAVSDNAEQP